MKHNEKTEEFFKSLASLYVEADGEILKDELNNLKNEQNTDFVLDKRIRKKITYLKIVRFGYIAVPLTACLIVLAVYFGSPNFFNNSAGTQGTTPINYDVEFISTRLPSWYMIEDIDYDNGKTVFYILTDTNNAIIVTVEKFTDIIYNPSMQEININGSLVSVLIKENYNLLTFSKDNIQYTLTDRYDYKDLIELSRYLI